jgi:hypothetical protein
MMTGECPYCPLKDERTYGFITKNVVAWRLHEVEVTAGDVAVRTAKGPRRLKRKCALPEQASHFLSLASPRLHCRHPQSTAKQMAEDRDEVNTFSARPLANHE